MKSIEEIRNRIDFAIANKEINGIVENDCLYIRCPKGYSPCVYLIFTFPVFAILVLAFFAYIGVLWRYIYWIPICYLIFTIAISFMSKDFLVFDYTRGQIYIATKFDKTTIWKGFYLDVRNIQELGINNTYFPLKNRIPFSNESEEDYIKKNFCANLVYLSSDGKLKNLIPQFRYFYDLDMLKNISCYCALITDLIEIPSKICTYKQKLEILNNEENKRKTLNIISIDLAKEKKENFKLRMKLAVLQFIITVFVPLEIFLIQEYGFFGSFSAMAKLLKLFFTEFIPRQLGLK